MVMKDGVGKEKKERKGKKGVICFYLSCSYQPLL